MYSWTRCQAFQFGNWLGFAEFLSCVRISCQWGCGTYFDSFVAKFVATCVWNGYQISEINLFVSSPLALFGECHWFAGAAPIGKEGSLLFALWLSRAFGDQSHGSPRNTCDLCSETHGLESEVEDGRSAAVCPGEANFSPRETVIYMSVGAGLGCGCPSLPVFPQVVGLSE